VGHSTITPVYVYLQAMQSKPLSPLWAWLLFTLLALTWGSSFILMKKGLASFSYTQIGLIRIGSAWVFTCFFAFKHLKKINSSNWKALLAVGLFGNGIPYMLFPLAIKHLDSSLVGVLNSMVPLFTLLIGVAIYGIRVKWLSVLGIVLGFLGALWLLLPNLTFDYQRLQYGLYPIAATICYAISINIINLKLSNLGSVAITLLSLTFVGPFALGWLFTTNFVEVVQTQPQAYLNLFYILLLGVLGSSLAIIIFNRLIKGAGSLFAASVTYAIPLVALFWGWTDGETFGLTGLLAMLTILGGVYLINLKGSPAKRIQEKIKASK
jgi:drug/metabolite transporter (DMT)-like permease